jgi:integrase
VFTRPTGEPLSLTGLSTAFKVRLRQAGLPDDVRLHDLRHGASTIAGHSVSEPVTVQRGLGHSSLRMTEMYMAHSFSDAELHAADAVAAAIYGVEETESVSNG